MSLYPSPELAHLRAACTGPERLRAPARFGDFKIRANQSSRDHPAKFSSLRYDHTEGLEGSNTATTTCGYRGSILNHGRGYSRVGAVTQVRVHVAARGG
jgi:hypothetical protein